VLSQASKKAAPKAEFGCVHHEGKEIIFGKLFEFIDNN